MSEDVKKDFEARVMAALELQAAELRSVHLMMIGTLATMALLGLGLALIGKEIGR